MKSKVLCIETLIIDNYTDSPYVEGVYYEYTKYGNYYHINIPGWSSIVGRFSKNGLEEDSLNLTKYFLTPEEIRESKINEILND